MQGRIVFATGNAGKIKEIRMIMEDTGLEVVSMKDAGIKADIEENGKTYEENALIKARAVTAFTKDIVMADDSGLEIDALNKEPGIYSARYLGEDTPYSIKNANLIQRLEGVPEEKRTARFVCAIAAVLPDGRELTTRATIEGRIGYEEKGTNGFGYDPIFYVPEFGKSTAELTEEEKNQRTNRAISLQLRDKGCIENVTFSNLNIDTRLFSKVHWWGEAEPITITAVKRNTETNVGYIRNVRFQNINCVGENGILIYGDDSKNIRDITFDGIHVQLEKKTDWPKNCHDLRPNEGNVILEDSLRVLYARNAENIHFRNFSYEITEDMKGEVEAPIFIENCENVEY